jgi:hypothetical protein
MVFNPVEHQSNKHVRIACHYTRELTEAKVIAPQKIATDLNVADIFTKPLSAVPFKKFTDSLLSFVNLPPRRQQTEHVFMLNAEGYYGPVVKNEVCQYDYYASDTSYDSDNSTQNPAIVRASDFDYDYVPPEIKAPDVTLVCTTCGEHNTEERCILQCRSAKCMARGHGAGIRFLWRRPGDPEYSQEELGYASDTGHEAQQEQEELAREKVKQERAQAGLEALNQLIGTIQLSECKVHVRTPPVEATPDKQRKTRAKAQETRKKAPPFNMTLRPRQACKPPTKLGSHTVAYIGRARRRGEYHHQDCPTITAQEARWQVDPTNLMVHHASTQYVNSFDMGQARCCCDKFK